MLSDAEKSSLSSHVKETRHPLIAIVGPTASGKTKLSIEVAKCIGEVSSPPVGRGKRGGAHRFGDDEALKAPLPNPLPTGEGNAAEIVNADSRQLYRFLNIGTGKIRPEEMQNIPHHLLDVLDPKEPVSIAWYQEHARSVIREIRSRGHVPILVGGSMLYVSSVIDGLLPLPSDPELRKRLDEEASTDDGAKTMHARLAEIDPEAAAAIHPHNKVYLARAMELAMLHEKAPTAIRKRTAMDNDLFIIGLRVDREALRKKVTARVDQMFADGWVDEVRSLLEREYTADDPAMESSGYREIIVAIANGTADELSLRRPIVDATMRYAKRQVTWWKHDKRIQWIEVM